MTSTGSDSNENQSESIQNRSGMLIQATTPYIPNNQPECSTMVDSLFDVLLSLQLLMS